MPQMPGMSATGFVGGNDRAVAGRGADHLDQRALAHAAADRAVVDVELSDGDRNAGGQPELRRPVGCRAIRRARWRRKPFRRAGRADRRGCGSSARQKLLVGQAAPFVAIERLVAGGADSAFDSARVGRRRRARRESSRRVRPRSRRRRNVSGADIQAMPDLGPEPFRGVDSAAFRDVLRPELGAELSDLGRLAPTGVILPQPALRVEVVLPLGARARAPDSERRPESGSTRSSRRRSRRPWRRSKSGLRPASASAPLTLSSRPKR